MTGEGDDVSVHASLPQSGVRLARSWRDLTPSTSS